jgi:hypothetical protein
MSAYSLLLVGFFCTATAIRLKKAQSKDDDLTWPVTSPDAEEGQTWDMFEKNSMPAAPKDANLKADGRSDWYANTMKPIDASAPEPANRLLTRKNVCIQGAGFKGYEHGMEEPKALARAFTMTEMPKNYDGPVVKGAVLVTTVHHFNNYIFQNIGHWSSSAYAIYDAMDALKEHNQGTLPVNVSAVLMHQSDNDMVGPSDWHMRVAQLVGHSNGLNTQYLKKGDLRKGICAEQVIIYDRPNKKERHFFTSPAHAANFQEHAIKAFNLPEDLKASTRKPGRVLNMVIRKDSQGYGNWKAINEKTKEYLASRCWEMIEYYPGAVKPFRLQDQVEAWAKGDLSISVHGAHFQNLVWQGQKTGAIIVEKKGWLDRDVSQLGDEMGIFTYKVGPDHHPNSKAHFKEGSEEQTLESEASDEAIAAAEMAELEEGAKDPILDAPMKLNFEKELKPVLAQAIDELEKVAVRGPPCDGKLPVFKSEAESEQALE